MEGPRLHDGPESLRVFAVCPTWPGQSRVHTAREQPELHRFVTLWRNSASHYNASSGAKCHLPVPRRAAQHVTGDEFLGGEPHRTSLGAESGILKQAEVPFGSTSGSVAREFLAPGASNHSGGP
jgi:hypothetical protein